MNRCLPLLLLLLASGCLWISRDDHERRRAETAGAALDLRIEPLPQLVTCDDAPLLQVSATVGVPVKRQADG